MAYCGINPQGYHGISFGSFVPKPSFKVRQLAASCSRRDAADREDYCFIRQHRDRRFPGCSLPEINVKRLFNKPKKKHSRSHTFGGASGERLKFPTIIPTATEANTDSDAPIARRREAQQIGEDRRDMEERRVVRNGEPWWKWSKRNHDHNQEKRHHTHTKQSLPRIENLAAQSDGKTGPRQKRKHVQHNLRQKLPPLVGYRDSNGNLLFSEAENSMYTRTLGSRYMYDGRNIFLNRKYYYSYSRDGIRPCHQETKVSNACLFDLSNLQPTNPDYSSHQEAMISSMHDNLQAVAGILPAHRLHTKNNSNLGAKVKQSLNRDHEQAAAKKRRKQPVVINIDSSYGESDFQEEEDEGVSTTAAPASQHPKRLNHNHLRALAILQELINVLNSTEFVPGSDYNSKEANSVNEIPTLRQINLGDFFQKPESFIKQYDHFKKFNSSIQHPHFDDVSAEQDESDHKESHKNVKKHRFKERDHFGLTQLLAVHRLQQTSNKNPSDTDLASVAAKLTARIYDSESIEKSKSTDGNLVDAWQDLNRTGEQAEGDQDQYPELSQLLAIQQLQASNESLANAEVPDESITFDMSEPTHSEHKMEMQPAVHHHFTQRSLSDAFNAQSQLVCVDLNDQYLPSFNNEMKKQISRHPTNRKLVHNVSKLLLIEPAERRQNSRPDLEISGEKLKHLYDLGFLNSDQELTQLAVKAKERVTVSREQLARIQDICDHGGIGDSTIQNPEAGSDAMVLAVEPEGISGDGDLPEIEISMDDGSDYSNGEDRNLFPEGIPHSGAVYDDGLGMTEDLHIQMNAEQDGKDIGTHASSSGLKFNRDLSWDLESEFARVQAMDLQQRLQMEQMRKERKVLDSVKRDLERFQKTLQSSSSGTSSERPTRQRESLLPPPPPPKKKTKSTQLKTSKKNEQQMKASANASTSESDIMENTDVSKVEIDADGISEQQQLDELGDQLISDKYLKPSALEEESMGEGDAINDQQNVSVDHSEIASDTYPDMIEHDNTYPAFPDMIEEESDGYLSDSNVDVDTDAYSDTEAHQLSQIGLLDEIELPPKSALKEENQVVTNDRAKSGDVSTRAVYNSVKSGLTGSKQEQRTGTAERTNTRGGNRPVSKQANMDSWSHIDTSGFGSGTSSASRGMRGSALSRSPRGKRISCSEFKDSNIIGEDMGPLSVSRPQTVRQCDVDSRTSSGQRSRLPTRERSRLSSQVQITVADPAQVLAHRKSELAKQQLMEAQKKEALLEQERERQRQEKIMRQAEFEDRMSAAFKDEEDEIRRQRKLKAEARRKAEELEKHRQALVQQMKKQEAEREAQEKARHSAMLEGLRQEAERRHLQVMHEKGAIEDYQDRISAFNEWDYAYIDHYMGDKCSQQARKIDQAKKLKQQQLLHQRMMEAFEYKRRELLEKLKAAQKELMMEFELEKGQLDHFVKISRAFVFTYFKRVPDQTFMVPQELLM